MAVIYVKSMVYFVVIPSLVFGRGGRLGWERGSMRMDGNGKYWIVDKSITINELEFRLSHRCEIFLPEPLEYLTRMIMGTFIFDILIQFSKIIIYHNILNFSHFDCQISVKKIFFDCFVPFV